MADNSKDLTVYQKLFYMFGQGGGIKSNPERNPKYSLTDKDLIVTSSKEDFERQKLQLQQQKYMEGQWQRVDNELYQRAIFYETTRIASYMDYEAMEFTPEIAVALDIMSEESCTLSEQGKILTVYSDSSRIKKVLEDLFYNVLDIHSNLPMWTRNTCKYGDNFLYLKLDYKYGIVGASQLTNIEIERKESNIFPYKGMDDQEEAKKKQVKFVWKDKNLDFNAWEIAHFRLLGDDRKLPYGTSVLEKIRRIWKQLLLAEDAMLVYRVTRAPERRVFKVYVGNIDDEDVEAYVQKVANKFKRTQTANNQTGQLDVRYNTLAVDQDFFVPVRDANASNPIETLAGACIALDTRIPLLDGRTLELQEIIKEWDNGNRDLWVYSCDPNTGELAPGMITWAGETRKNAEVIKITLDNGDSITTTPDHKWVHRTKGFVEAKDLIVGDSLMPFYTDTQKINKHTNEYHMVWDNHKNEWVYTHRMVNNFMKDKGIINEMVYNDNFKNSLKNTIHHKDINRFNNNPSNLVLMNNKDHYKYHSEHFRKYCSMGGQALKEKLNNDPIFREEFINDKRVKSLDIWNNYSEEEKLNLIEKRKKGILEYFNNINDEKRKTKAITSKMNSINSRDKARETFNNNPNKNEIIKLRGIKISETRLKNGDYISECSKKNWLSNEYRNKVFSKRQNILFNDFIYENFVTEFKKCGKANLAISELNKNKNFISEFKKINSDIRSSMTNLNEFTYNHLIKMVKSRGFKNITHWRKSINNNYNHKIVNIEWLESKMDTGTITVDGNEIYHNYHTFATESGVFIKNSNLDQIADIQFIQRKLVTALRIPKPFLGFEETNGDGKNLALQDVRFARTINRIQQSMIQELNKIAIVHLYILGFHDELGNFKISLNNPSTQGEMLKVEQWKEKVLLYKDLVGSIDGGLAPTSHTWAKKNIFNWSEDEILLDLEQQRLERAAGKELENTAEVIKKTGFFDKVDKLYGEITTTEIEPTETGSEEAGGFGGEEAGGFGGSFGGGFGGGEETGEEGGGESATETGGEGVGESFRNDNVIDKLLLEGKKRNEDIMSMTKGIKDLLKESDFDDNEMDLF